MGNGTTVGLPLTGSHTVSARVHVAASASRGRTILALHGFTGSGEDFASLRMAIEEESCHWVCLDFPGHGRSDSPADLEAYSLGNVLSIIEAARQLAPDPDNTLLLGYSMGARIALHYLCQHPTVPALLIGGSPGLAGPAEREQRLEADQRWIRMLQDDRTSMDEFCSAWELQPVIQPQTLLPEPFNSSLRARRRRNSPVGLAMALRAWGNGVLPSLWDRLPELVNVALVNGEYDTRFCGISLEMSASNPRFTCHVIPGCGHSPHLEDPAGLARMLSLFI